MSEPLLAVEDLRVEFATEDGVARVIDGVDLSIDRGETAALVGETGCGKSVTAKAILGLLSSPPARITSGEIRFEGRDLLALSDEQRHAMRGSEMSMIMQDPMTSLNPVYTVGEQMVDVLKWQGQRRVGLAEWLLDKITGDGSHRERAVEMLEAVQISAPERVFDSHPVELSGGMRQRVLIAIAMLLEPELLVADEPGTALDVTTEDQILELLSTLTEEAGTSVLYITHDLGIAKAVSDHVNVMYAGEVVERAPTAELFESPQHPYTRGLLDSIPRLATEMGGGIGGELPDYTDPPAACRFADRCPHAEEACRTVDPHPRAVGPAHSVACHLHDGEPTYDRHREHARTHRVDIGEPPWEERDADPHARPDGGTGATADANTEPATDADTEPATEAATDDDTESETDADAEAVVGSDAEPDAGADAGSNAEPDAGADAGSNAEPDADSPGAGSGEGGRR